MLEQKLTQPLQFKALTLFIGFFFLSIYSRGPTIELPMLYLVGSVEVEFAKMVSQLIPEWVEEVISKEDRIEKEIEEKFQNSETYKEERGTCAFIICMVLNFLKYQQSFT